MTATPRLSPCRLSPRLSRRRLLPAGLCLLLSACGGGGAPVHFDPLTYDYLRPLRLDVANVEIDDRWHPPADPRHVESLAPVPPLAALRRMARDRLIPAGNTGVAHFIIQDASITQGEDQYQGSFAVRLTLTGPDGASRGTAEARVVGTHAITDDDLDDVRSDLYDLTRQLMNSMNVELEFQIGHGLRNALVSGPPTTPTAPPPPPVEQQDLGAPSE